MPAFSMKDFTQFFVGLDVASTIASSPNRIDNLTSGEIGIFCKDGRRMTEALAATETEFIIAQGRGSGNPPIVSGLINKNNLVDAKCTRKAYTAPTEQVDYVGFNGTSGSIDIIDGNLYYIRINLDQSKVSNHGGQYIKHGAYKSPISGTLEGTVAFNLTESLVKNFSREKDRLIKFERVHSDAGSATTGATGTMTATYGVKTVGCAGGTPSTDFSVGSLVRFGTAVTSPVYKVTAIDDTLNTITLDIPYQGTTGTFAAGAAEFITPALELAGDYGIKMTALTQTFTVGALEWKQTKWVATLENFTNTTVTNSTASTPGSGAYQMVASMEWFYQGNEGTIYRNMVPTFTPRAVVTNQGYDIITLQVEDVDSYPLSQTAAFKTYILALSETAPAYAIAGTANDITDVLEVLVFGSANGNLAIS